LPWLPWLEADEVFAEAFVDKISVSFCVYGKRAVRFVINGFNTISATPYFSGYDIFPFLAAGIYLQKAVDKQRGEF
jgi:hypothetical protein